MCRNRCKQHSTRDKSPLHISNKNRSSQTRKVRHGAYQQSPCLRTVESACAVWSNTVCILLALGGGILIMVELQLHLQFPQSQHSQHALSSSPVQVLLFSLLDFLPRRGVKSSARARCVTGCMMFIHPSLNRSNESHHRRPVCRSVQKHPFAVSGRVR